MSNKNKDIINKYKQLMYENLSYTNQDFESIMEEMLDLANSGKLPVKWTNLTETDPIVMLFALFAAHKDILNYMVDYRVGESYMSTARERASMVRIAESYGYNIPSYSSARVRYEINVSNIEEDENLYLKKYTPVVDTNGVSWVYLGEDKTLTKSDTPIEIDLFEGVMKDTDFDGHKVDPSNNTVVVPGALGDIALSNVYDNTDVVALKYGDEPFTYINLSQTRDQGDEVFEMGVDTLGMTYIRFNYHLDIATQYPNKFYLKYLITSGDRHITPVKTLDIKVEDMNGVESTLPITYKNNSYMRGKNPPEDNEIKEGFKNYYAGLDSLVTVKDYANYILNVQKAVPNISKCFVLDKQTDSSGGGGNSNIEFFTVAVYVTKDDGEAHVDLTSDEKTDLEADLNLRKMAGIGIQINEDLVGVGITVNITGEVKEDKETLIKDTIKNLLLESNIGELLTVNKITSELISKSLLDYFAFGAKIEFGSGELSHDLDYNQYVDSVTVDIN